MRPKIFLPQTVSEGKMRSLEQQGADLELHGNDCLQAETAARMAAREGGLEYISPYNDLQASCICSQPPQAQAQYKTLQRSHVAETAVLGPRAGLSSDVAALAALIAELLRLMHKIN